MLLMLYVMFLKRLKHVVMDTWIHGLSYRRAARSAQRGVCIVMEYISAVVGVTPHQ